MLYITAYIKVEFDFEQAHLNFGKIDRDETVSKSAVIKILDPDNTRITGITTSSPLVQAVQSEDPSGGKSGEVEVEITLLPGLPPGRLNESVVAESNLESCPTARLRVTASVLGPIEIKPEVIRLACSSADTADEELPQQSIEIRSRSSETALEILEIEDPQNRLEFALSTIEEGRSYRLTAKARREALPSEGGLAGAIRIVTNVPEQSEVTVRYTIVRTAASKGKQR